MSDTQQAIALLESIADQIPMLGHEEDIVFGAIQSLAALDTGDKTPAAQQVLHLLNSVPLTRPIRKQAKDAIEYLRAQ